MKPIHVITFLGTQLDSGNGAGRWEKWRPTVALTQHEDMEVARLDLLLTGPSHRALAERVRADIGTVSPATEVVLHELAVDDPWDFDVVYTQLFDWARAQAFDTEAAQYWAHITTGTHVAQICLFLLTESRVLPGVLCQTSPPKRQREGAAGAYTLIDLDLSRYDAIAQRHAADQRDAVAFLKSGIATRNARFNALIDEVERVAVRSTAPVLFVGPTGAGKSFLARRMHELKKSRHQINGAFVEVNCATLRGDGAASTLFGHKRGAFTGAATDRPGLLRAADGGLLFLDEIGELGADEQAMLLMAIEDKRFYPLGSDREVTSDFQLVAGTNRDLRAEVAAGRFREDLFSRINLWTYELPGLAGRPEDIEPNVDYLLTRHAQASRRAARFNVEARRAYLRFAQSGEALWRGNFRDLYASVTRLATLAEGGRITEPLVVAEIKRLRWMWTRDSAVAAPGARASGGSPGAMAVDAASVDLADFYDEAALEQIDLFDRVQLQGVIAVCQRSRTLSDAGRQLYQASRAQRAALNDSDRLRKYLAKFNLSWDRVSTR
ncbi:transcriptional regulator [Comamonas serinivorans]|uniref:Transcriptional regulator n=1 Tax=Comamonas serinivorans TaxID=1082851 RepID=A0A1Y0EKU4_9BURK|nr:RNA repair transcriptional activator RtcR [Comamonas serinivorans]ARU04071.1 transcriptional regulator [Comamonas serinivorans]